MNYRCPYCFNVYASDDVTCCELTGHLVPVPAAPVLVPNNVVRMAPFQLLVRIDGKITVPELAAALGNAGLTLSSTKHGLVMHEMPAKAATP